MDLFFAENPKRVEDADGSFAEVKFDLHREDICTLVVNTRDDLLSEAFQAYKKKKLLPQHKGRWRVLILDESKITFRVGEPKDVQARPDSPRF